MTATWRRCLATAAAGCSGQLLPARSLLQTAGQRSIFDEELRRCSDAASVLAVASSTSLPLMPVDLLAFFDRLKAVGKLPKSGAHLRHFVAKVKVGLVTAGPDMARLAVSDFADLRCRQGALVAWPGVRLHVDELEPLEMAEAIWAASAIPKPPPELGPEVETIALRLAPKLGQLPQLPLWLYRCTYGIARLSRGSRCQDFRRRAEQLLVPILERRGGSSLPPAPFFAPSQLVRLCWALARLGSRNDDVFDALEPRLRHVVGELSDKELEAVYRILTDIGRSYQWKLIHDVERAMEVREDQSPGQPDKVARKANFGKKWTRVHPMTHSVLPKQTRNY